MTEQIAATARLLITAAVILATGIAAHPPAHQDRRGVADRAGVEVSESWVVSSARRHPSWIVSCRGENGGTGTTGRTFVWEYDESIRAARAEAWREGALWAAVECGAIASEEQPWLGSGENPYEGSAT